MSGICSVVYIISYDLLDEHALVFKYKNEKTHIRIYVKWDFRQSLLETEGDKT